MYKILYRFECVCVIEDKLYSTSKMNNKFDIFSQAFIHFSFAVEWMIRCLTRLQNSWFEEMHVVMFLVCLSPSVYCMS